MKTLYTTSATSTGQGRVGKAALDDGSLELTMAAPTEMGGTGEGVNPEQLFALGYASCFHSALSIAGAKRQLSTEGSTVSVEVDIGLEGRGLALAVRLNVSLPELGQEEAQKLGETAHKVCPYSNATRDNIPVELSVTGGAVQSSAG